MVIPNNLWGSFANILGGTEASNPDYTDITLAGDSLASGDSVEFPSTGSVGTFTTAGTTAGDPTQWIDYTQQAYTTAAAPSLFGTFIQPALSPPELPEPVEEPEVAPVEVLKPRMIKLKGKR